MAPFIGVIATSAGMVAVGYTIGDTDTRGAVLAGIVASLAMTLLLLLIAIVVFTLHDCFPTSRAA